MDSLKDYKEDIDFGLLEKLFQVFQQNDNIKKEINKEDISNIKQRYAKKDFQGEKIKEMTMVGLNTIHQGKVALLILAGGQGSRLGFNKAKGMYNIGMPSNKSLFCYLCERFLSAQRLSGEGATPALLLIMTSLENHEETVEFFKENNYFGIRASDVIFFPQDTMCALDMEGKIIMKNDQEPFKAPNGNGGCFIAMKKHKIVEELNKRQVDFINVVPIDNPLNKVLDPFLIGLTLIEGKANPYQIAVKSIPKKTPNESIGVFLNYKGKPVMMDYVDIPKSLTELANEQGQLIFGAGNMLNYLISVQLLKRVLLEEDKFNELISQFHFSKKKIPIMKDGKELSVPGIKFELFFNSIFEFAEREGFIILDVDRDEEFAPVKNSNECSTDSPDTCKRLMSELFRKWYKDAGLPIPEKDLEISFLKSYDGENLL